MMLAKIGTKGILKSKEFLFEPKLDGYRALLEIKDGFRLSSRTGRNMTKEFPGFDFDVKKECVLDGEIVVYDERGNPSFSLIKSGTAGASYVAFDIISLEGKDLRMLPLEERKRLLEKVAGKSKSLQVIPSTENGEALWKIVLDRHLEGVIAKRKASRYVDLRSGDWLKIKNEVTVDCVIVGFISKIRQIASLSLALYDGQNLLYVGQVGTGFTDAFLKEIFGKLKPQKNDVLLPRNAVSVLPEFVCEIKYLTFTKDMKLRAPVFVRLRDDKDMKDCTLDQVRIVEKS